MNTYAAGALVKLEWEYRKESDNGLIDPSAVYLWLKNPNDQEFTWVYGVDSQVVRDSTGTYYSLVDTTNLVGLWVSKAYSTGTAQGSTKEWEFETE